MGRLRDESLRRLDRPADLVVLTPERPCAAGLAIAASRAGALGLLDLSPAAVPEAWSAAVRDLSRHAVPGRWGVRCDALAGPARLPEALKQLPGTPCPLLVLAGQPSGKAPLRRLLNQARALAREVWLEVDGEPLTPPPSEGGAGGVAPHQRRPIARTADDRTKHHSRDALDSE